jgi:hypothetical protein
MEGNEIVAGGKMANWQKGYKAINYNYFNNHITIQNSTSLCQYNVYRNQDHLDLQD